MDSVIDITIAYPCSIPQNEGDIIKGMFPAEIHFHATTFPNSAIPSSKLELDNWCKERFAIKEETLKNFYEKKSFPAEEPELKTNESLVGSLFLYCWVAWTGLELLFVFLLWTYPLLWIYVFVNTVFYACVSKYTKGFNMIIADLLGV